MTEIAPESTRVAVSGSPAPDQPRPKRRRSQGQRGRGQEGGDARPPRQRVDKSPMAGWGDGIERCMCSAAMNCSPRAFPVQHRTGLATIAPQIVDRTPERILLCDGQHPGPHVWPDGVVVVTAPPEAAASDRSSEPHI